MFFVGGEYRSPEGETPHSLRCKPWGIIDTRKKMELRRCDTSGAEALRSDKP